MCGCVKHDVIHPEFFSHGGEELAWFPPPLPPPIKAGSYWKSSKWMNGQETTFTGPERSSSSSTRGHNNCYTQNNTKSVATTDCCEKKKGCIVGGRCFYSSHASPSCVCIWPLSNNNMWTTLYAGAAKQTAQSFYHNNNSSPTDFFNIRQEIANVVSLHNVHQDGWLAHSLAACCT